MRDNTSVDALPGCTPKLMFQPEIHSSAEQIKA